MNCIYLIEMKTWESSREITLVLVATDWEVVGLAFCKFSILSSFFFFPKKWKPYKGHKTNKKNFLFLIVSSFLSFFFFFFLFLPAGLKQFCACFVVFLIELNLLSHIYTLSLLWFSFLLFFGQESYWSFPHFAFCSFWFFFLHHVGFGLMNGLPLTLLWHSDFKLTGASDSLLSIHGGDFGNGVDYWRCWPVRGAGFLRWLEMAVMV